MWTSVRLLADTDPTVWVGGSTVLALVSVSIGLLVRMLRTVPGAYTDQIEQQGNAIDRLQRSNTELRETNNRCERRNELLIRTMRENNVEIPREVWEQ